MIPDNKIMRFEAIEESPGHLGCGKSHEAVLRIAIENDWRNVLIIEDDMVFSNENKDINNANVFLKMLSDRPWDVALLSGNYYKIKPLKCSWLLVKLIFAYCTSAYIVNREYYPKLIDNFRESVALMEKTRELRDSIDVHWHKLMEKDNWFSLYSCLGHQKAGHSNILNGMVDYKHLYYKSRGEIHTGTYCTAPDGGCISSYYYPPRN